MEDADSGQPKAKKKKTEKGNEKLWWYVELFFLLNHVCVRHLPLPNNSSRYDHA